MEKLELNDGHSLHANVYRKIEEAILDGSLRPGDALIEQKLSETLGVSRTPVREALRQLELQGMVKNIPNRGCFVVGFSKKDILDMYAIRIRIESLAARWAAENITPDELGKLQEIVDLQTFYVERGDTLQVWSLDNRFHDLIFTACRSRMLRDTLSSLHRHIQRSRELSVKTAGRAALSVNEHRKILEAIAAHDADLAEACTSRHIAMAMKNVSDHIDE